MRRRSASVRAFVGLVLLTATAAHAAQQLDVDTLKRVTSGAAAAPVRGWQDGSPRPLVYFAPGDIAPSCGLRAQPEAREVLPMIQASPREPYPACEAITRTQRFALPDGVGHVFSLRQRDTREDVSTVQFFVHQDAKGALRPIDDLNEAEWPRSFDLPVLATWAKAQWHARQDAGQGWTPEPAHAVVVGSQFMNPARRAGDGRCRAGFGERDAPRLLGTDDWPCSSWRAASQLTAGSAHWWLVASAEPTGAGLRVYRSLQGRLERMTTTEDRLAPLLPQGLPAVKRALAKDPR